MYQNGTYIGINKTKKSYLEPYIILCLNKKINIIETKGYGIHAYRSRWHDGVRALEGWCLQGVHIGKHITGIEKKYSEHRSVLL